MNFEEFREYFWIEDDQINLNLPKYAKARGISENEAEIELFSMLRELTGIKDFSIEYKDVENLKERTAESIARKVLKP